MQKYCLVYLIEKLQEGDEFTAINYWPLHITIASNFIVDSSPYPAACRVE